MRPPLLDETLRVNLRKLELLQLERRLDAVLEEKDFAEKSFKEQLNQLLEEEVGFRQERAIKMRLKLARFPVVKTIDAFDFTFQPELDKESVLSLFSLAFVQDKSNIVFIGPSGVGKTHLAIALLENLRKAEEQNRLRRKLQSYSKPHVLVIDELGYLPLNRSDANLFFQLVSTRYEAGSMILTSNKSYIDWGQLFPDEGIAAAVLDRLLHYSKTIKVEGASYRLAMKKKMGLFQTSHA